MRNCIKGSLSFKKYIFLLLTVFFLGCTQETNIPIDTLHYEKIGRERNHHLFVLLPGRDDGPTAYKKNGFIEAVRKKGLAVDMVAVDAHLGYYKDRSILVRLKEDVVEPAKAKGYDQIWFIGISMGGLGSLLYAREYADEIAGLLLMAPYLGEEEIIKEINQAGGIKKWNPNTTNQDEWDKQLWL